MKHPQDDILWDYVIKSRSDEDTSSEPVRRHIETGCDECVRKISTFGRLFDALVVGRLSTAPAAWVRRAAEIDADSAGSPVAGLVDKLVDSVREIAAALVSDSMVTPAFGVRGTGSVTARTQFFESELGEVYLQITPASSPGSLHVRGQLVPNAPRAAGDVTVELIQDARTRSESLDVTGDFQFDDVIPTAFEIRIVFADAVVVVRPNYEPGDA